MDEIPGLDDLIAKAEVPEGHNGINMNYLSPSTINSFIERRPQWYRQKVLGEKFKPSPNMARGTAIEHAINGWIETRETENMHDRMMEKYQEELKNWFPIASNKALEKEKEIVETMPRLLEKAFQVYEKEFTMRLPETQAKIGCRLPGTDIDILGYLDYLRKGIRVNDMKIVSKTPSGLSQGYVIQGSLYKYATGCPVTFDHFIPLKKEVKHEPITLTDDQYVFGISYATKAILVLQELQTAQDPRRIMELMAFPNLAALWTYEEKAEAAEAYGISI